jgi:hypothetical protein
LSIPLGELPLQICDTLVKGSAHHSLGRTTFKGDDFYLGPMKGVNEGRF